MESGIRCPQIPNRLQDLSGILVAPGVEFGLCLLVADCVKLRGKTWIITHQINCILRLALVEPEQSQCLSAFGSKLDGPSQLGDNPFGFRCFACTDLGARQRQVDFRVARRERSRPFQIFHRQIKFFLPSVDQS